jgi:hypothetical protein
MSDRNNRVRDTLITFFPMFIATISVVASLYSAWLFARSVEVMQSNVDRGEIMRACKDVIDNYFQIKVKAELIAAGGPEAAMAANEAVTSVAKFGALGTYLANFNSEAARVRYTQLSHELARIVQAARTTPPQNIDKLFEPAEKLFATLNDDCVRTAHR